MDDAEAATVASVRERGGGSGGWGAARTSFPLDPSKGMDGIEVERAVGRGEKCDDGDGCCCC